LYAKDRSGERSIYVLRRNIGGVRRMVEIPGVAWPGTRWNRGESLRRAAISTLLKARASLPDSILPPHLASAGRPLPRHDGFSAWFADEQGV